MKLEGKIALITGSSRGLGKAAALSLAREGADIIVNFKIKRKEAENVVSEIQSLGRKAIAIEADVANPLEVNKMAQQIVQSFGRLDILVNNAGAIIRPASWNEITDTDIDKTIGVNLKAAIYCIRAFTPNMINQKGGRIINITTTYAITGAAAVLAYTSAKAGIISITYSMARELGQYGITVNAVAPGNIMTDMAKEAGSSVNEWAISTTPLGRLGQPEEVGEAVLFLAKADFITGHVLVVDGGQILNM